MNNKFNKVLIGISLLITASTAYLWQLTKPIDSPVATPLTGFDSTIDSKEPVINGKKEEQTRSNEATRIVNNMDNKVPFSTSLIDELFPKNDPAWAWAKVDLESIKQEIPDNLYWTLGAPTTDSALLEQRKENKDNWDKEYGKVLSNTATEKEIRAYYAHLNAVSTDYIEFATLLLNRHSKDLPEEAYGLQTLARNLHLARLEEIPGKLNNAVERRNKHVARREVWLADKEGFEANLSAEREEARRALGKI